MTITIEINRLDVSVPPPPSVTYDGYRWLHGAEGGRMPPLGKPEINPPYETRALEITEQMQYMILDLMKLFCLPITPQKIRNLHRYDKAMTNFPQNGFDGGIPHSDHWNKRDLTASLPRYDKMQRGFGGSFFRGIDEGELIKCVPGIHCIDAKAQMPSVKTIVDNVWYVVAVSTGVKDAAQIDPFPQGYIDGIMYPIVFPFIADRAIYFEKKNAARWVSDELPNVTRIFNPVPSSSWRTPDGSG
jgi:hypothetical protein